MNYIIFHELIFIVKVNYGDRVKLYEVFGLKGIQNSFVILRK